MSRFLKSVKNFSAKRILSALRKQASAMVDDPQARLVRADGLDHFWQPGPGYDKNVWTMEKAVEKANYCHRNPVARGLVTDPAEWKWSSYRSLELGDREPQVLPVDSWDEGLAAP